MFNKSVEASMIILFSSRGKGMRIGKGSEVLLWSFLIGLVIAVIGFSAIGLHIRSSVDRICTMAQRAHPYPGDDMAALIEYVNSDRHSLQERNKAVWAVGRLRDPRALPYLEHAHTGGACNHEKELCQHELDKAIRLCREHYNGCSS